MRTSIRDIGRVFGALFLGAAIVSTVAGSAVGQEKKASRLADYDEKVTVKKWTGSKFAMPVENVPMFRKTDDKGVVRFWTWPQLTPEGNPEKGSEITDKDGGVWVVKESTRVTSRATVAVVEKKPAEKKP